MLIAEIDPNVRVNGNKTYIWDDDICFNSHPDGLVQVGDLVLVFESEAALYGPATVALIEQHDGCTFYYLDVEWQRCRLIDQKE